MYFQIKGVYSRFEKCMKMEAMSRRTIEKIRELMKNDFSMFDNANILVVSKSKKISCSHKSYTT